MRSNAFMSFNHFFASPLGSVIGAVLIFLLGYFAALVFGSLSKRRSTP